MELQIKFLLENLKEKLDWFNNSTCKSPQYSFYACRMFKIETLYRSIQCTQMGLHFRQIYISMNLSSLYSGDISSFLFIFDILQIT